MKSWTFSRPPCSYPVKPLADYMTGVLVTIWRGLSPPWQAFVLAAACIIILTILAAYDLYAWRSNKQPLTLAFGLELLYAILLVGGAIVYQDVPAMQVLVPSGTRLTLDSDVAGGPSHGTSISLSKEALGSVRLDTQNTAIALPSGTGVILLRGAAAGYSKGNKTITCTLPSDTPSTLAKGQTVLTVARSQSVLLNAHHFIRDLLPDPVGPIPLGIPFLGALGAVIRGLSWSVPPSQEEVEGRTAADALDSAVNAKVAVMRAREAAGSRNAEDAVTNATEAARQADDAATAAIAASDPPVERPAAAYDIRWHIIRPILGAGFSAFTFLFFLAILGTTVNGQPGGQWGVYLLAFVVGYSDGTFAALIQRTVNVLLGPGRPQSSR